MYILGVLLLIFFIRSNFKYEKVRRIKFLIIPVFSLSMFIIKWNSTDFNLNLLFAFLIVSLIAGFIQSYDMQIKRENGVVLYKGGLPYLVGWVFVILAQIALFTVTSGNTLDNSYKILVDEIERDLFIFMSFTPRESATSSMDWFLVGCTGVFYCMFTCIRHVEIRKVLLGKWILKKDKV